MESRTSSHTKTDLQLFIRHPATAFYYLRFLNLWFCFGSVQVANDEGGIKIRSGAVVLVYHVLHPCLHLSKFIEWLIKEVQH